MRIFPLFCLLFAATAFAEPGVCPDGRININDAPAEVLMRLKGVGEKKAAAIIADRTTNGRFANTAALNRVRGVGDKSLENWAAQIAAQCGDAPAAAPVSAEAGASDDVSQGGLGCRLGVNCPGVISLNTATLEQLSNLPGIGPKTAEAIIAQRTQKSGFKTLDELGDVKGIGAAKLAKLKPLLKIE